MGLLEVLAQVSLAVIGLITITLPIVVGPNRLWEGIGRVRSNLRAIGPTIAVLVVVLAANRIVRNAGVDLSWIIDLNITGWIYSLEGRFVPNLQSFATPPVTLYFELTYVVGYVFILAFPVVLYVLHTNERPLREHLVAYAVNYGLGVLCYVVIVAYGPRNFFGPEQVESLLYTNWPQSQLLTSQVNTNTNVFPSLHASLATTITLLAYRFRGIYPRWLPIVAVLGPSVIVSTMYLGIHWATDVVAGIVLAVISVAVAARVDEETLRPEWWDERGPLDRLTTWRRE